ncbi:MAG: protein translocase subunit SecF, partial [Longimicrobiales bacterium]
QGRPAVIQERIGSTGSIELPGRTMREAGDLALVLRAGALPVPLEVVADGTVGPSLGNDSIQAGLRTSLLAVGLVVVMMVGYYRFAGVLAVGALATYLLGSISGLALFGFTLTLPGIAGFALAIGMAVDANVLIFERIREELRQGRGPRLAVNAGFRHAMSAIVDSNVTTALTAAILHLVGTEAVKGFAVMLLIGICASMFAAIFVTRTLFMVWLRKRGKAVAPRYRTIPALTDASYDALRWRRWALGASAVFMLAGLLLLGVRGPNYGIDFTGGTLLQVRTEAPVTTTVIRAALADSPLGDAEIQSFGSDRDFLVRTRITDTDAASGNETGTEAVREHARQAFDAELGSDAYELVRGEGIGPKVGAELQTKAALAIAGSFATTLAYLAVRFEGRFGLAAVAATAHDILATLAFISFLDLEVSLVTVAGVLTVLGYSLNDTIVIFDRVRENLRASSGRSLRQVLNDSINQTLPRTVLTTATTLGAALLLATLAGPVVRPLGLVMSFGIVVGTLSSIYVASPVLLWLSGRRQTS